MFDFLKPKKSEKESYPLQSSSQTSQPLFQESQQSNKSTENNETVFDNKQNKESNEFKLLIDKIESLRLGYELLNEKLERIEKMIKEIYDLAKS
ncbi:MAG: hypothetical protein QXL14_00630 [Candidatus Aenigmatarchaeota archaeon]